MRTWSSMKSDWESDMYSSQDMRNAHPCALSPSRLLGVPRLTLEGCDAFRGVVIGGGEARGGGAIFVATSWLAMTARNLFRVLFIAQVASNCSLSLISICWNLSSSMAGESSTFDDCYRGGTGGSRL
jgi:hypothetical protein